jgi:hypothetical protein
MPGKVFIFGAGASREDTKHQVLPMPLADDFFNSEYINAHYPENNFGYVNFKNSALATILSHYFGVKIKEKKERLSQANL